MQLAFVQFLTGLASASSLFLVASGLSIIFGVTRIVNFAHGAFYMLGAYVAYSLTERLEGAVGFWFSLVAAAAIVAAVGALFEIALLRRIYRAPELFQLLATFGATLAVEDLVVLIWGPEDLVGPRAPGLRGAIVLFGKHVPAYDLLLIALGPIVLAVLWLLFHRTRWGVLVRAATQDRDMVAALGVNQKWLFTGVFALGTFLAALGGALQIPRDAVSHTMDLRIIVEVFVVVVIGGLGSTSGAFVAAIVVSELNAFGILVLPKISLVLVFLVMAVTLVARPWGLFGKAQSLARASLGAVLRPWKPLSGTERALATLAVLAAALLPLWLGDYGVTVGSEVLIFALFAASLHLLMSVGGLVSFGHAAYFGLGAYGAALAAKSLGLTMLLAIPAGPLAAARLRPDSLVDRFPVGVGDGRRQRHIGGLARRLRGRAGEVLLAYPGARRRRALRLADDRLLAVRLRPAGGARFGPARRVDRHRSQARAMAGLRHRRGRRGTCRGVVRVFERRRLSRHARHSDLDRRPCHGARRRRRDRGGPDRRRPRLQAPVDLAD
jgi:branched-chain amino acid transport system permease protein